jgi:hypothetical protein
MKNQCTWQRKDEPRCQGEATHPQVDKDGSQWANLCKLHHELFDSVLGKDVKLTLAYWIAAQGGPKAAAKRMTA